MALILDDQPRPPAEGIAGHATLDDLFRRAAARRPDALALADPPNRASFTDAEARQLRIPSTITATISMFGV